MMKRIIFLLFFTMIWSYSCQNDQDELDFGLTYPDYFPAPHYQFGKNTLTKEGFELGRSLFFDPILSLDSTISCASCHAQGHAFADHNVALSKGIYDLAGTRNSPSMFNLAWQPIFMWDGGINHIEVMPLAPITNPVEMGQDMNTAIQKLNNNPSYSNRFRKVFGEKPIESQQLFYALAQYMSMLVSADSKYDKYRQGKVELTLDEGDGLQIFRAKCASCHKEPLFTDYSLRNNGLEILNDDLGYGRITLDTTDNHKFKVPSLRNVALTYPYMHDGRFRTLDQVLDHYSNGLVYHTNIDPLLVQNNTIGIPLNDDEKQKLKAFLNTLSDYTFISNPLYSK
ncbi:MAG TPA: cytochrome c peroxidase [Saprospiraceae bacterium]|nr:cytochrome c peroxidase [Saprospiraceae bacterium]HMT70840.1 cytochrome c peroxidase [Saprospiraceae bacterium]